MIRFQSQLVLMKSRNISIGNPITFKKSPEFVDSKSAIRFLDHQEAKSSNQSLFQCFSSKHTVSNLEKSAQRRFLFCIHNMKNGFLIQEELVTVNCRHTASARHFSEHRYPLGSHVKFFGTQEQQKITLYYNKGKTKNRCCRVAIGSLGTARVQKHEPPSTWCHRVLRQRETSFLCPEIPLK